MPLVHRMCTLLPMMGMEIHTVILHKVTEVEYFSLNTQV